MNTTRDKNGAFVSKLTDDDVRLILALCDEADQLRERLKHLTHKAIGEKFGVSRQAVERYKNLRNTRCVT